jgi:hypothetical protein
MAPPIAIPMARRKVVLIEVLIVTMMHLLFVVIGRGPAIKSEHTSNRPGMNPGLLQDSQY